MAPSVFDDIEDLLKLVIQDLYEITVQIYAYQGPETSDALVGKIKQLTRNLKTLSATAPHLPVAVPPEIIEYVEDGRNPDIYTREFVELAQRNNQMLKGRAEAFASFRDVLAEQISSALPELKGQVEKVVQNTGGKTPFG